MTKKWYAIIDCNSFYASVEKVFRPELRNKPVAVLSNNDGIIVALSQEAKDVGLKRGDVLFKIKDLVKKYDVAVFSSNYILYYDFSRRIETVIRSTFPHTEKYSIDEMFVEIKTADSPDEIKRQMSALRTRIFKETKIQVSIGVAQTKTLSKIMNRYAKKDNRYNGVAILRDESLIDKALQKIEVGDVWGIGRSNSRKLISSGIKTASEFSRLNDAFIKKNFTINGLRTAFELRGKSVIKLDDSHVSKKSILCSRSFGKQITEFIDLQRAVSDFVAEVAGKLRVQNSLCKTIGVFLHTDRFKKNQNQYYNSINLVLPFAANDNMTLQEIAFIGLQKIFLEGYSYKKAGVYAGDLYDSANFQYTLWDDMDKIITRKQISKTMDFINSGEKIIYFGIQKPIGGKHEMNRTRKSPDYTTNINEVPKINMDMIKQNIL